MKFGDLEFRPHPVSGVYAMVKFDNGYSAIVLCSSDYGSDGENTFEVSITSPSGGLHAPCTPNLKKVQVTRMLNSVAKYGKDLV